MSGWASREAVGEREAPQREQHPGHDQRGSGDRRSRRAEPCSAAGASSLPRASTRPAPSRPWRPSLRTTSRSAGGRLVGWSGSSLPHPPEAQMISLQRVTKTYKNGVTALADVTVEVEKGEFVFIVGQSGSGKSTMIRLLLKEEETTQGRHLRGRQEPRQDVVVGRAEAAPQHRHGVPGLQAAARTRPCSRTWRSRSR